MLKLKKKFSSHGGYLIYTMHHHRETIILTYYDKTEKISLDSQLVEAKENLSHCGPSQATGTNRLMGFWFHIIGAAAEICQNLVLRNTFSILLFSWKNDMTAHSCINLMSKPWRENVQFSLKYRLL